MYTISRRRKRLLARSALSACAVSPIALFGMINGVSMYAVFGIACAASAVLNLALSRYDLRDRA